MPLFALCPGCQELRIQVYEEAVGQTLTCPHCQTTFRINGPELIYDPVAPGSIGEAGGTGSGKEPVALGLPEWVGAVSPNAGQAKPGFKKRPKKTIPSSVPAETEAETSLAESISDETLSELPDPQEDVSKTEANKPNSQTPPHITAMLERPRRSWDIEGCCHLGSIGLAVLAFGMAFVPNGQIGTIVFGGIGILLAGLGSCLWPRKLTFPILGGVLNALAMVGALVFLGVWGTSGVETFQEKVDQQVHAIPHDGSDPIPTDWVNVDGMAWQYRDVRVNLIKAYVGTVTLTGPDQKTTKTLSQQYLHILLRLKNAGVRKRVEFRGWNEENSDGPELTDSTQGMAIPRLTPPKGWAVKGPKTASKLAPLESSFIHLIFERPSRAMLPLRLRLPGIAFDSEESVQLLIPDSQIQF
ncbi:MAG: hypothetical protein ACFCD0_13765 [Gemmataceae bacterium]